MENPYCSCTLTGGGAAHQGLSSCFPSIDPAPADGKAKGFVSWQGRFMEGSKGGAWAGAMAYSCNPYGEPPLLL